METNKFPTEPKGALNVLWRDLWSQMIKWFPSFWASALASAYCELACSENKQAQ